MAESMTITISTSSAEDNQTTVTSNPNIALVVLDTLRKDAFEKYFNWLPGEYFENAWSTSNWTTPAHASLFTGSYATEVGVYSRSLSLDCNSRVLAECLAQNGYTTRAFSANPNISTMFHFDRGFDQFKGSWRLEMADDDVFDWHQFGTETDTSGLAKYLMGVNACLQSDTDTIRSLKQGIRLLSRKLNLPGGVTDDGGKSALKFAQRTDFGDSEFLFMNLMEAHSPYDPPKSYRSSNEQPPQFEDGLQATIDGLDIDPQPMRQAYNDSVKYLSDIYRNIFDKLQSSFDYVITVSDHGEMFGEHGIWRHEYGVYPQLTNVPIVITGEHTGRTTHGELVSLLDVHQTILSLSDTDTRSRGVNLLESPRREMCLTEYHGISHPQKLELLKGQKYDETTIQQYDDPRRGIAVADSYYGYETFNGFEEQGEAKIGDPKAQLDSFVEEWEISPDSDEALTEGVSEQLRDLGYM